ncbi:flavin-containing monooxygenase [Rhodococcus tukisamuensis]|uniref:flavin-containing monooxygenase n=1 Tax=Rhodococcus tukisamuensis TaxID=168276 RepID=UPI001473F89A|nr:NAD(P)/FAD-dependent oxidoreductase [Rhodococcus tukisamuensis]
MRAFIDLAETPALLMVVAHLTNDVAVLRDEWRSDPNLLPQGNLDPQTQAEVRRFCLARLEAFAESGAPVPARPSAAVLSAIGDWGLDGLGDEVTALLDQALVADFEDRRAPDWTLESLDQNRDFKVAIIGAGISGLLAGLRMKQANIPFVIFEKGDDVGGTWNENTYPNCRTDVHSHIYAYSFFPYDWPSYFCRQEVILNYLRDFAKHYGLYDHIRFGVEVENAAWDEGANHWTVATVDRQGGRDTDEFHSVVSAVGQLNRPSVPNIPGLETFEGAAFHSAEWDHSVDLTGKKVVVIGSGASALQFAPAAAEIAEHVTIMQRTPPWLFPTPELRRDVSEGERWLLRHLPMYRAYYRFTIFLPRVVGQLDAATVDPQYPPTERAISHASELVREDLTKYLLAQIGDDEELIEHVIPNHPPAAKRIIRDDGTWIRTLKRDNVTVVKSGVPRVDGTGIWTDAGEHIDADVILFGTGFAASDFLSSVSISGVGGQELKDTWAGEAGAFMGLTVPEFPNFFMMYGPNTNLVVHGNLVFFMECQAAYLVDSIKFLIENKHSAMNLRPEVYAKYRNDIDDANRLRAWGWSGVSSWYKGASGRSPIMWPLSTKEYWEGTREMRPEHYSLT